MATARPISKRLPWLDRQGRFAPLKALALLLVAIPALWLLYRTLSMNLGPKPFTEAVHRLGDWTVYLLLITLAVTPARTLFEWPKLIQLRRMIGVAALSYVLFHFMLFFVDSKWNLFFVAKEIALRFYLTIGFVAISSLAVLGATSTDAMIRRLGAGRWNRLHKLIYPATFLAILHYYLQSKIDVSQPVLMSGFFFWLMGHRIMARYGWKRGLLPLLVLSLSAALLTVGAEALWYELMTGVGGKRLLLANLQFSFRISPAWWVLAAGLTVTLVAEIRQRMASLRGRRQPQPA
ncbi:MAG: sulfite oxidase heme-binding subunit YedZ [Alphaproteobacteria bacterium]